METGGDGEIHGPLDEDLDRLYQLPLGEFVKARNDLADALKKNGDGDASRRVRDLAKPSQSAWAVNQLYWKTRGEFERLVAAADAYRRAQQAALAGTGSDQSAAERERRRAIEEATRRIRTLLASSGQAASESLMRRITATLEALASYGSDNPNPMRGRLSEDLESPGFGALSSLAPPPTSPPSAGERLAIEMAAQEKILAEARAALSRATAWAERSTEALEAARRSFARASDEARRAASEVEEAKARVAELEERARKGPASGEAAD